MSERKLNWIHFRFLGDEEEPMSEPFTCPGCNGVAISEDQWNRHRAGCLLWFHWRVAELEAENADLREQLGEEGLRAVPAR